MRQGRVRKTPKVFGSSYQPVRQSTSAGVNPLPFIRFVVLALILYGITRLPIFAISDVTVEGTNNAELAKSLTELEGTSIFSGKIAAKKQEWYQKDSSLADIICRKGLPSSLHCQVRTRVPSLVWVTNGKEYLVDENGVLYAEKSSNQQLDVPFIEDRLNTAAALGNEVASGDVIGQVVKLKTRLNERGIHTERFFIQDSLYQLGVTITQYPGPNGEEVKRNLLTYFITTQPLEAQVKTLQTLLKERGPAVTERVDLRVPGYVYYR